MLVAAACGHDSRLDRADALMYPQPDKALALLDSIDPATLRGEADRARYALLYSQAQNKNHIFPTSDSLIDIAVDYYDRSGHDSLRMLTHFYRSAIRNSAAAYHAALRDGLMAKDIAEQLDMPYWVARASQEIADAYYQSYDMDNAIKYSDIAARDFNRTGYHLNAQYVLVDKAVALSHRSLYTESLRILDSMANVVDTTDYNICAFLWDAYMRPLNALGRHKEALTYANKSISVIPLIIEPTVNYCDIADLHLALERLDSAAYFLNKGKTQDSVAFLYSNSHYLEKIGDFKSALNDYRTYFQIRNKLLNQLINDNISVEEKEFIEIKARKVIEHNRRNTIIVVAASSILVLLLILLVLYMRARNRIKHLIVERRLSEAMAALDELNRDKSRISADLNSANERLKGQSAAGRAIAETADSLFKSQFCQVNELYEKYIECKGNKKINTANAITSKIDSQLSQIASPESIRTMQDVINRCHDNLLIRLSEQIRVSSDDLTFITLIMAGLSPKTICLILDIKRPTFYSRRKRLVERIESSDTSDTKEFIAIFSKLI